MRKLSCSGEKSATRAERSAEPNAPTAKDCYGPILDIIAKSGVALDAITLHSRGDWQARANWKAMLENYLECYHCAVAHPGFSAAIDVRPDVYTLASHGWFSSQAGRTRTLHSL